MELANTDFSFEKIDKSRKEIEQLQSVLDKILKYVCRVQRRILTSRLLVSSLSTHLVHTVVSYGEGDTVPGLHLHF